VIYCGIVDQTSGVFLQAFHSRFCLTALDVSKAARQNLESLGSKLEFSPDSGLLNIHTVTWQSCET